ncbi:unnamed protein product [Adineta steineri]|uniref:Uncharacterized protein n=1 Tax=Adineta steineri TaxID=433720 RepID=A0A819HZS8_9BILA|nr:unnamed protein product [Adineta steineri]CAF3908947.1 unnamed protein product [Adineta steineri]
MSISLTSIWGRSSKLIKDCSSRSSRFNGNCSPISLLIWPPGVGDVDFCVGVVAMMSGGDERLTSDGGLLVADLAASPFSAMKANHKSLPLFTLADNHCLFLFLLGRERLFAELIDPAAAEVDGGSISTCW